MKRILTTIQKNTSRFLLLTVLAGAIASCDSVLNYDEDCSTEYCVKFKYDYNMEEVDIFSQVIRTVTLYAFDDNGNLVYQNVDEGEQLADLDYSMKVDFDASKYHIVVWAGLNDESFAVPLLYPTQSKINELNVKTLRNKNINNRTSRIDATGEEGKYIVNEELHSLWHGEVKNAVTTRNGRESITTVNLVKNTNNIHITVAQVNQSDKPIPATKAISKNNLECTIYDDNGYMNYDNTLLPDNLLTYEPFAINEKTVTSKAFKANGQPVDETDDSGVSQGYNAVVSEISVARLVSSQTPRLTIKSTITGEVLVDSENIIELLDLLRIEQYKDKYGKQEYLDREDDFNLTFFVNEKMALINSVIEINGWIIHIKNIEL